jgi:hypothetical protein
MIIKKKETLLVATVVRIRFITNSTSCSIIYTLPQRIKVLFVFYSEKRKRKKNPVTYVVATLVTATDACSTAFPTSTTLPAVSTPPDGLHHALNELSMHVYPQASGVTDPVIDVVATCDPVFQRVIMQ